jgi:hypothetical protein
VVVRPGLPPATKAILGQTAGVEQQSWPRSQRELNEGPIQVRVPTVERIFNPMDPSPLQERSLNPEVAGRETAIVAGLRDHFEYREWSAARRLSLLWRDGRISLAIGVTAIVVFTTASRLIGTGTNPVVEVLHQGLSVVGWVSMWKPIEIFLYEWWPIRRELRAYRRLAAAEVTFPVGKSR